MATPYQLPSSFSGGMQGAIDSLKRGQLPQSIMSPVKDSSKVKQTILPKKNVPKKWTVKIDDGSTLQFDNEPTPQDIEEAFAQMKAPQPKAPIFQDKYAGEGSVMQTLKALPRAALETGKQVVGNLQGAFESGSNVINSGVSSAYKGVTGRQLPGFGTAESGFTEQKQKFDVPSNLAQFGASATGLATQATPVGLSTNLGFNLAAELPGVQYAPQAIGAGIQGASNIVSDVTGISPEITQNLTTTALNTLFLRSAGKQSAPISQAYAKSGQLGALKELGMSVPRTTVDIAKQPIQAVIGTAKIPFKIADWAIGKTAQGLLTNKTGTQELFQASSPSINKIGNKSLGLDKLREKSAIADETIVKLGYRPKNTTERAEAYQSAMGDIWNQIEQVRGGVSEKFSGKQLGAYLRDRIEKSKVNGKLSPSQQRDANTLNDWATYYESLGDFDTPTLSGIRTQINGETTWNKKLDNGDLFNKTFQDLAAVVRKTENNVIDSAKGGQFQDLMNRYGALTTLLEDVIKQDIKLQRAKGEGLTTTYSRIEGIGDVLKGGIGLIKEPVTGLSNIASGLGKLAVGKTLAKLKDTDFLIENGYNKLYKSLGLDKGKGKLPTKKVYQEPEGLKPIQESSNIPKSSPVNNTQKEASKATLPKVEQKQTEVSKSVLPGNKVNTPIIPKTEVKANLPKESKLPKKQNDWTKKDFTKATETKSVDKYGNTIAREQGKTSAVDSITVGGKKYTNIDIPDSSRTLYELDGKIYEYKDGKMISEGANLPKTPQEGKTAKEAKLDATINKQLIEEAKNHTDFVDFFQSKLGDKQPTKENLMKLGFSAEDIARNTDSLGISLEDLFHEIKTGKLSSYPAKPKPSLPLSQKSEVKYSEPDLASEAKKYKDGSEFYERARGDVRKKMKEEGIVYKSQYEEFFDKNVKIPKVEILDTVNPTGSLFVDYTPQKRANSTISSKDLTTLDKTLGKSPDDYITIYRGTVKGQKEMNPGDFVTDMPELAKSYAGGDKIVISKRVKYSDVIDSIKDGGANEYLYIPKEMQKWDKANKKSSLPMSAKSEVKYSKPEAKTTLPVEIQNLPLTDRIPGNELKIKPGTGEIYFEGKKIKEFTSGKDAMDWIYSIEDNPEYQKFIKVKKDAVTAGKQNITDAIIKKAKTFDDISKSSQVKDTVFHGTPQKDFIQFKLGEKSNTGTVDAGEAIWFTNSKDGADYWSNYSKDGGRTLEVKILSKNMAEVSGDEIGGQFGMLNTIEQAKNEGYDGLIIDQGAGEKWYAVFDPENAVTKQYYDKIKANKKSALPLSQKSEVKYSEAVKPELEPLKEFLTKQKNYDDKFAELSVKANEIAKEYPGVMGTISEEGRKIPANKKILEDLAYYKKLSQSFNELESSKKFIKQMGKMSIMERKALRNLIK